MSETLSPPAPPEWCEAFLDALRNLYVKEHQTFELARPLWSQLQHPLHAQLNRLAFTLNEPLGLGTTGVVWKVFDNELKINRALKVARPDTALEQTALAKLVRAEPGKLALLNHPNVIGVHHAGQLDRVPGIQVPVPYFLMTFVDGLTDLEKLTSDPDKPANLHNVSFVATSLIRFLHQISSALQHLHTHDIVHCDLKLPNIFVGPDNALVGDLGYAKYLQSDEGGRQATSAPVPTPWYAHPDFMALVNAAATSRQEIERSKLEKRFDLFALGRSLLLILYRIQQAQLVHEIILLSPYEYSYLAIIAKRLLAGVYKDTAPFIPADHPLASREIVPGMPLKASEELAYKSAGQVVKDAEKLLHLSDLEGKVPELDPDIRSYIQIPLAKVPLTPRVKATINHPYFSRLARVSQLGFVSLVYPGATHTRFEHSLGVLAKCCQFVRALWYDAENPLFQCVMGERDVGLVLLAALLHDVAQYPMAHDLAEVDDQFSHEDGLVRLLMCAPDGFSSLEDVIWQEWRYKLGELLAVLAPDENSTFRQRLLNAVVSGPMDCDKMDYLPRDSVHLGINVGLDLDLERLGRHVTVLQPSTGTTIEVGVTEKVLPLVEAVLRSRENMFRQVYWHHSVRELKAMLAYVTRSILVSREKFEEFQKAREAFILTCSFDGHSVDREEQDPRSDATPSMLQDITYIPSEGAFGPLLSEADDALLGLLRSFAGPSARNVIRAMRSREFYSRMITIRGDSEKSADHHRNIYSWYKEARKKHQHAAIEEQRLHWEKAVLDLVAADAKSKLREDDLQLLSKQRAKTAKLLAGVVNSAESAFSDPEYSPIILFDVPVKTTSRRTIKTKVWFLREAKFQTGPEADAVTWDLSGEDFDKRVGKIRILAHPDWKALIAACVREEDLRKKLWVY